MLKSSLPFIRYLTNGANEPKNEPFYLRVIFAHYTSSVLGSKNEEASNNSFAMSRVSTLAPMASSALLGPLWYFSGPLSCGIVG